MLDGYGQPPGSSEPYPLNSADPSKQVVQLRHFCVFELKPEPL